MRKQMRRLFPQALFGEAVAEEIDFRRSARNRRSSCWSQRCGSAMASYAYSTNWASTARRVYVILFANLERATDSRFPIQ